MFSQTDQPQAVKGDALPQDMQGFTYCFTMDYLEGEDHTIERPERYDFCVRTKPTFGQFGCSAGLASAHLRLNPSITNFSKVLSVTPVSTTDVSSMLRNLRKAYIPQAF